jgi:hypothetical protein
MEQLTDVIKAQVEDALARTHTATVGRVVRVGETTIDIQPVINMVYKGQDLKLPVLVDVPPVFHQGGASYTAYPIAVGDYALVIFAERCFDRWYAGSDEVRPPEMRMHDYSDGFAFVGVNPMAKAIAIPAVITQVGDTNQTGDYVHTGNRTQIGDFTQTGDFTLTGDMNITGNLTVSGSITAASATIGGIDFATHVHVKGNGSTTQGPQ